MAVTFLPLQRQVNGLLLLHALDSAVVAVKQTAAVAAVTQTAAAAAVTQTAVAARQKVKAVTLTVVAIVATDAEAASPEQTGGL